MHVSTSLRRLLAIALVAQPLLVGVNATFHPAVEFTAEGMLAGAAADPTTWYVVHLVAALGALLTVPAVLALRTLVTERGRRVANVGVVAGTVAAAVLGIAFGIEASVFPLAVSAGLDDAAQLALAEAFLTTPEFFAAPIGVLAFTLAGLLLATALLAARAVPRWKAVLYLVGMLATLGGAPGSPLGPIAFGILTVAAATLSVHVARGHAPAPEGSSPTVAHSPQTPHDEVAGSAS